MKDMEQLFEEYWNKTSYQHEKNKISKQVVQDIWDAGNKQGYKTGKKVGRDEAAGENW